MLISRYLAFALPLFGITYAQACTDIKVQAKNGDVVIGRTMEFAIDTKDQLQRYLQGQTFQTTNPDGSISMQWRGKYNFVGIYAQDAKDAVFDGVNEHGLAAEALLFPHYADYGPKDISGNTHQKFVKINDLLVWILSQYQTVSEVKKALSTIRIWAEKEAVLKHQIPELHFVFHDKKGNSIVVEYEDNGQLKVYDNKVNVMTNSPSYHWHLTNLKNYLHLSPYNQNSITFDGEEIPSISQGNGFLGLPGDYTSSSRFVKQFVLLHTAVQPQNTREAIVLSTHILNNVDIPKGAMRNKIGNDTVYGTTLWSVIKDLSHNNLYVRTYDSLGYVKVDLNTLWQGKNGKPIAVESLNTFE